MKYNYSHLLISTLSAGPIKKSDLEVTGQKYSVAASPKTSVLCCVPNINTD